MGLRDRRDDRQAEARAFVGADPVRLQPPERLGELGYLLLVEDLASVLDDQLGASAVEPWS